MVLTVQNISKTIKKRAILCDVSGEFESGKVYGFIGRNGSGKTMLFRAISGLIKPDRGEIILDGKRLHHDMDVLPSLGMIIENADMYPGLTGKKNLVYLAKIKGIATENDICNAITRVGLDPDDKRTYRKCSLGMKQRLKIAQAIMEKPDIIILDEPTNGLDEDGVKLLHNIVSEEKKRGALILLSSHNKEDIEQLAD